MPTFNLKRIISQAAPWLFMFVFSIAGANAWADARYDGERAYWGLGATINKTTYLSRDILRGLFDEEFRRSNGTSYNGIIKYFDDVDKGFKFFWGYSINKLWDWEVGYVDLGSAVARFEANDIDGPWTKAETEANSWNRGFFGHVQYSPDVSDNLELMIRLGILRWDARRESVFRTQDPDGRRTKKEETKGSYDEYFGLGLAWHWSDKYALRADIDRYHLGDHETNTIAASLIAYF